MLKTLFRFIGFMAVISLGAYVANAAALRIRPDLREKSPWLWLSTGPLGALVAHFTVKRIFAPRRRPASTPPDSVPLPAPLVPKTYEEWRKDLARTVDETAPDFLPLDEFVQKWSDIPRTGKTKPPAPEPVLEPAPVETPFAPPPMPCNALPRSIVQDPNENVMRYIQEHVKNEIPIGGTVVDVAAGGMIKIHERGGTPFKVDAAGAVKFCAESGVMDKIRVDGIDYVFPPGNYVISLFLPAGWHFAQAVPKPAMFGKPHWQYPDQNCDGPPRP